MTLGLALRSLGTAVLTSSLPAPSVLRSPTPDPITENLLRNLQPGVIEPAVTGGGFHDVEAARKALESYRNDPARL